MTRPVVKFKKLHPDAVIPTQAKAGDAGFDVCSVEECLVQPNLVTQIPLGIAIEVPEGYYVEMHQRSSLGFKKNLTIPNSVGIIDEGYRGEIKMALTALDESVVIAKGERIAQLILKKREEPEYVEVEELTDSERGEGGFGSTGA